MKSPVFAVEFAPAAVRDLKRLDPNVRQQLLHAGKILAETPYPAQSGRIKMLVGIRPIHFCLRVGEYRIVYRIENQKVIIIRVAHRKEVYR